MTQLQGDELTADNRAYGYVDNELNRTGTPDYYYELANPDNGLKQLSLSNSTILESVAVSTVVGAIVGKTSGSTLALTGTSGGKFALSGTNIVTAAALDYETAPSHQITLRETLAAAPNSPRDTTITITVTNVDEGTALGPFTLAWTSAPTELTNLSFSLTPAPLVGDVVTLSLDNNSDLSSPFATSAANTIDAGEASSGTLTFTGIATPLAVGLTYARVNVTRGASNVNSSITSATLYTPITFTSGVSVSNTEGTVLAHTLTASEPCTFSIVGGTDAADYELSGSTLRWVGNGVQDYGAPADSDGNNTYVVTVRATATAVPANTVNQTITTTVAEEAMAGWTPLDLGAKLLAFYDPKVTASITGDPVSQANDLSPNADHMVQANALNRPDLDPNAFGTSKPGLKVGMLGECLTTAAGSVVHSGTKITIAGVAIMNPATCGGQARLASYVGPTTNTDYGNDSTCMFRSAANTLTVYAGVAGASATLVDNTRFRFIAQRDGTSTSLLFNGVETTGSASATSYTGPGRIHWGSSFFSGQQTGSSDRWGGFLGPLIVCNDTLTAGERTNLDTWLAAWPVTEGGYVGPGDILPGATAWYGLRAYSAATAGTPAIRIRATGDSAETDINTTAAGHLDVAAVSAFLTTHGGNAAITKIYNQSGLNSPVRPLQQGNTAFQPLLVLSGVGALPIVRYVISSALASFLSITRPQPFSHSIVTKRTGNTSAYGGLLSNGPRGSGFGNSPNNFLMFAGSLSTTSMADNVWHTIQAVYDGNTPGTGSKAYIDGGAGVDRAPGTEALTGVFNIGDLGGGAFVGDLTEAGEWPVKFTPTQAADLDANQAAYWNV